MEAEAAWSGKIVMLGHSGGVLWHRGSKEAVEDAIRSSSCLLAGEGKGRLLTRSQGKFKSEEAQAERCMCVSCFMWLCVSLVVIKVKSGCLWDSLQSLCITWFSFVGSWRDKLSLRSRLWLSSGKDWVKAMGIWQLSQGLNRGLFLEERRDCLETQGRQKIFRVFLHGSRLRLCECLTRGII